MKKSLLIGAAAIAAGSVWASPSFVKAEASSFENRVNAPKATRILKQVSDTRASETMPFTYSQGIYSLTKLSGVTGGKTRIYLLFEMEQKDIKGLAGDKVTGFSVVSPSNKNMNSNSITEGRFFYSFDLSKEDYSQDFTLSKTPFELNNIDVETPYTITGEEESLYFGYSFVVPKTDNMYYLPFDGVPNPFPGTGVFASSDTDEFPDEFISFAFDLGALTMAITVEGESYPEYAKFFETPADVFLPLGEPATASVAVAATSSQPIESLDFEYTLRGKKYETHYDLPEPISAGSYMTFYANVDFPAFDEQFSEDITLTITKFNGRQNEVEGSSAQIAVVVLKEVPVHQTLYEEYTGVWCGYCPRGFAALEYMRSNYPEFVTASFHYGQATSKDPMQVMNTYPTQIDGFPSAALNRSTVVDPYYGSQIYDLPVPVVGDIEALNALPTVWKIKVGHTWESEDLLVAQAEATNVLGYSDKSYKIAYLLVADGLKGDKWVQSNYYSSDQPTFVPELNAFCRGGEYGKRNVVGLVFNDVVVSPEGVMGVAGSIPTSMEAEAPVSHSLTFDLSKISETLIPDKNKLRVIAMVLDKDGKVLNCAKDEVNDFTTTGVAGIDDENAPVEYFNLNGMKVAQPTEGVFIRRQGGKTSKVLVR